MSDVMALSEIGMTNDMRLLAVIAHNLANVNTMGFKRSIATHSEFADVLNDASRHGENVAAAMLIPRLGTATDFTAGALHRTGNPLDVAIEGKGFFELRSPQGVLFARRGSFSIDATGRLVDPNGYIVSGDQGGIVLHGGSVKIDAEGVVREDGEYAGRLTRVTFAHPEQLVSAGAGTWRAPATAGTATDSDSRVRQGYLEASNVDALDEMVRMMLTVRRFETTQRVLSGYDEMIGTAIRTIADF